MYSGEFFKLKNRIPNNIDDKLKSMLEDMNENGIYFLYLKKVKPDKGIFLAISKEKHEESEPFRVINGNEIVNYYSNRFYQITRDNFDEFDSLDLPVKEHRRLIELLRNEQVHVYTIEDFEEESIEILLDKESSYNIVEDIELLEDDSSSVELTEDDLMIESAEEQNTYSLDEELPSLDEPIMENNIDDEDTDEFDAIELQDVDFGLVARTNSKPLLEKKKQAERFKKEDLLTYYDLKELIQYKSIIYHKLYGLGRFIENRGAIIVVRFDNNLKEIYLPTHQYNDKWFIKNLTGYQFENRKVYDISDVFEHQFFESINHQIENDKKRIQEEIYQLPLIDAEHASIGNKIAEKKHKLQAERSRLVKIWNKPYFGRIDMVQKNHEENATTFYIGDEAYGEDIIYRWDERAVPFYDQEMYSNEMSESQLTLKRDYVIKNHQLISYEDNLLSIKDLVDQVSDERLKRIILQNRAVNIKNIVSSIQTNQYRMISYPYSNNVIIMGCAGSGKTMILAHRLSFWAYRMRDELDLENTYIVSTTKLLSQEFNKLGLDIERSHQITVNEFYELLINHIAGQLGLGQFRREKNYLTNNLLDDNFIYETYQINTLDDLGAEVEDLAELDSDYSDELKAALDKTKLSILHKHLRKKGEDSYYDISDLDYLNSSYKLLMQKLGKISHQDISRFLNSTKELRALINEYSKLKKNKSRQLRETKKGLQQFKADYPEFSMIITNSVFESYRELKKLSNQMIDDQNCVREIIKSLNYNEFISTINEFNKEVDKNREDYLESKRRLESSYFFNRRSNQERFIKLQQDYYNSLIERNVYLSDVHNYYMNYGLTLDTNMIDQRIIELNAMIDDYAKVIAPFLKIILVIDKYRESIEGVQSFKNSYPDIDDYLSGYDQATIKLAEQLQKSRNLLSNEPHNYSEKQIISVLKEVQDEDVKGYSSNYRFLTDYNKYLHEKKIQDINSLYEDENYGPLLYEICEIIINNYKAKHKIPLDCHYEFELFLYLYFLSSEYNVKPMENKMLLIDEVQDYSYAELKLINDLFVKTPFNYFGDMNQSINAKGLSQIELDYLTKNYNHFDINENYRNAKEITDYVNRACNQSMRSIGLPGCVKEISFTEMLHSQKAGMIVVVSRTNQHILDSLIDEDIINIIDDLNSYSNDKINVFTPNSIKGLEYSDVYVITKDMKQNEKYVAFTRAMTNLYVIN